MAAIEERRRKSNGKSSYRVKIRLKGAPEKKKFPATARRYLAALPHALSAAMKEWGWLEDNLLTLHSERA